MFGLDDTIGKFNRGYSYENYAKAAVITLGKYINPHFDEHDFDMFWNSVHKQILEELEYREKKDRENKLTELRSKYEETQNNLLF